MLEIDDGPKTKLLKTTFPQAKKNNPVLSELINSSLVVNLFK